jgi:hypothetical protein
MIVNDYSNIKSIKPKFPDITNKRAVKALTKMFYNIKADKDKLAELRMKAIVLEQELKIKEAEFNSKMQLFDIEFEKKEVKEIKETNYFSIINPTDYRNTNIAG